MDDQESTQVGTVNVHITKKEIYKAIRNILANEFKLDPTIVKNDVRNHVEKIIQEEVVNHIGKAGWNKTQLESKVSMALQSQINNILPIVKEAVKSLVYKHIQDEVQGVLEAIIKTGMEVTIGWNKKVKVKVS